MLNTGYELIFAGLFAAFSAQLMKFIGHIITYKKVDFLVLATTGGMPSSHSAGVCAMTMTSGLVNGFSSFFFAIAAGFSLVVMYDAAGLRRSAGKMAASLNRMMADFYENRPQQAGEKLRELLGHTPFEVFVGAIWGIFVAWAVHLFLQ